MMNELEMKRKEFEARETDVCKGCSDRMGIPCLKSARCEKWLKKEESKGGSFNAGLGCFTTCEFC